MTQPQQQNRTRKPSPTKFKNSAAYQVLQRIQQLPIEEPFSITDVWNEPLQVRCAQRTVQTYLSDLARNNFLVRQGDGRYLCQSHKAIGAITTWEELAFGPEAMLQTLLLEKTAEPGEEPEACRDSLEGTGFEAPNWIARPEQKDQLERDPESSPWEVSKEEQEITTESTPELFARIEDMGDIFQFLAYTFKSLLPDILERNAELSRQIATLNWEIMSKRRRLDFANKRILQLMGDSQRLTSILEDKERGASGLSARKQLPLFDLEASNKDMAE